LGVLHFFSQCAPAAFPKKQERKGVNGKDKKINLYDVEHNFYQSTGGVEKGPLEDTPPDV
jgi:hypothetical protein